MDDPAFHPTPATSSVLIPAPLRALLMLLTLALLLASPATPDRASAQTLSNSALVVPPPPVPGTNEPVEEELRDIAPPVEIPSWAWLWWLVLLAALVAAGVMFYRRWREKCLEAEKPVPIPPHIRARERLRRALPLIEDPRVFCGEVSTALRVYLEEQFQLHAPERTTEEFLVELKTSHHLNPEQKRSLSDFLQQCDLVKFARHEPPESDLRILHESALRLVDETQFSKDTLPEPGGNASPPLPVVTAVAATAPPGRDPESGAPKEGSNP